MIDFITLLHVLGYSHNQTADYFQPLGDSDYAMYESLEGIEVQLGKGLFGHGRRRICSFHFTHTGEYKGHGIWK